MSSVSKSPWIIHYDGSSCNGCDIEVLAALTPLYDVERFGIINTGNPKHADIFLVTGGVNERNIDVVKEIYDQMVEPKVVVACGVAACHSGHLQGLLQHHRRCRSGYPGRCVRAWLRDPPRGHHRCSGRRNRHP